MVCSSHKSILELRQLKKSIDFHCSMTGDIHSVRKVIYV